MSREKDRKARELAFMIMFSAKAGGIDIDEVLERTIQTTNAQGIKAKITKKVTTWKNNAPSIDNTIENYLRKGSLNTLALVARTALQLGLTEMEYIEDIPPEVAIFEAVEIVKTFGDDSLAKFVNGVLDARLQALRSEGDGNEKGKNR